MHRLLQILLALCLLLPVAACGTDESTAPEPTGPYTETVNGVTVTYETQQLVHLDGRARNSIEEAVERIGALSPALADEIRAVPVYVVDYPDRCKNGRALPPGKVLAGCYSRTEAGEPFVELSVGNNGHDLFIVVHEFGHIIGNNKNPWGTQREITYLYDVYLKAKDRQPATRYGENFFHEAYADEFAWYVLRPDDLRRCCAARFAYFEELFATT